MVPQYRARPVAFLRWMSAGRLREPIPIYPNDKFYIGRNPQRCRLSFPDPTISNRHLLLYCIVFEEDSTCGVPPLVYVQDVSSNGTVISGPEFDNGDRHLKHEDSAFLLTHGETLHISPKLAFIFHTLESTASSCLDVDDIQAAETQLIKSQFSISSKKLGVGGFGAVFLAVDQHNRHQIACKVVRMGHNFKSTSRCESTRSTLERYSREFEVLKHLAHPNIVQLVKVFWSYDSLYIFQELVTGGDLYSYVEFKGGYLQDADAAVILTQLLRAVEHLHGNNIVHRDIKPDNILMTGLEEGARIVLTDFGSARYLPQAAETHAATKEHRDRMFSVVGTYEYCAPEVHKANCAVPKDVGYSKAVDMWSVGAITAAVLTGDVIFIDRAHPDFHRNPGQVIMRLAAKCNLDALDNDCQWRNVGKRAKDFIKRLLILDESQRMTVEQALRHPWFSNRLHAAAIEALYQRAVSSWKPCRKPFNMVEFLDTSNSKPRDRQSPPMKDPSGGDFSHVFYPQELPNNIWRDLNASINGSEQPCSPLPSIAMEASLFGLGDMSLYRNSA